MKAFVIVFMVIAAIFALSSLGYVGYDIWKEVRGKRAQPQETPVQEEQEPAQEAETEAETEAACETEEPVAAE